MQPLSICGIIFPENTEHLTHIVAAQFVQYATESCGGGSLETKLRLCRTTGKVASEGCNMNGICQLAAKWSSSANAFIMLTSVLEIGSRI